MVLLACSGFDGPPEVLGRNIDIANYHAGVAAGLCIVILALFAVKSSRWIMPTAMLVLLALHPAWTISALGGDCGFLKRDAARLVTGVGVMTVCWQLACLLWSWRFARPQRTSAETASSG